MNSFGSVTGNKESKGASCCQESSDLRCAKYLICLQVGMQCLFGLPAALTGNRKEITHGFRHFEPNPCALSTNCTHHWTIGRLRNARLRDTVICVWHCGSSPRPPVPPSNVGGHRPYDYEGLSQKSRTPFLLAFKGQQGLFNPWHGSNKLCFVQATKMKRTNNKTSNLAKKSERSQFGDHPSPYLACALSVFLATLHPQPPPPKSLGCHLSCGR